MVGNKDLNKQYSVFCKNVRFYRKKMNMTQEMLAEKSDLSTSYIKQIESTKEYKNVSLNTMFKLSKALDIDIQKLFEIET